MLILEEMGAHTKNKCMTVCRLILPWTDVRCVSPEMLGARQAKTSFDLNKEFRLWIQSPEFRQALQKKVRSDLRVLENQSKLRSLDGWRLHRALHLDAVLSTTADVLSADALEDYLHFLGTGRYWYFSDRYACATGQQLPNGATDSDALEDIGNFFVQFLESGGWRAKLSGQTVQACIEHAGQLPFAAVLMRWLGDTPFEVFCAPGVDPFLQRIFAKPLRLTDPSKLEPVISLPMKLRGPIHQGIRVIWQPRQGRRPDNRLQIVLERLRLQRIRVSLLVAPWIDNPDETAFLFKVIDAVLGVESLIDSVSISVRGPGLLDLPLKDAAALWNRYQQLSDMMTVQLESELKDASRLAPHHWSRPAPKATGRLLAAPVHRISTHFDLERVVEALVPYQASQPYRLGRGFPIIGESAWVRSAKAQDYMVFVGARDVVALTDDDETYADAVAFFAQPRRAGDFVEKFASEAHGRIWLFLESLIQGHILSYAADLRRTSP